MKSDIKRRLNLFYPSRNSPCLCGSGFTFKRCCADHLPATVPGDASKSAIEAKKYKAALKSCRADIAKYTIWHKRHTEPAIRAGAKGLKILEIDLKALAELADKLIWIYHQLDMQEELPSMLERLRVNSIDSRWQRKITYFQAAILLVKGKDRSAIRKELKKLGSMEDETDVQTLQLYLDAFSDELSFSETVKLIDRILKYAESDVDRLHYSCTKAVQYMQVKDIQKARDEVELAVKVFREAVLVESLAGYSAFRYADALSLLGNLKQDNIYLDEASKIYKKFLEDEDLKKSGRADIYNQLGEIHKLKKEWSLAYEAYKKGYETDNSQILKVFMCECLTEMGKNDDAISLISEVEIEQLNKHEYIDYVFELSGIALVSGKTGLLAKAKEALKALKINAPIFEAQKDELLITVIEAEQSGISENILIKAKRLLSGIKASHFVIQPNFMGIGVNVNNILDDLSKGRDIHSDKEKKSK